MRCAPLTLVLVTFATLAACKDESPPLAPIPPPHDGVTLIQRGAPPYQTLRYRLTRGTRTISQLVCDLAVKNDGENGPMPILVVDLDTSVEEVLPDGNARLRLTVTQTSVRDRLGSPVASDMVLAQATAMHGVVIAETLAPDGQLVESHVEAAASVPDRAREQLDHLTRSLAQVAMRMPVEPVGIGATWRERRTLPEGGIRAVSETLYTLTSITPTTLVYSSVGLSSGEPQTIEQEGLKVEVTNTRGYSQAQGTVDLARYAFDVTSTSTFATAMNIIAPLGTPGAGRSTVEITMAIRVAPIGDSKPLDPNAPSGVLTAGSTPNTPTPADNTQAATTDSPPPSAAAPGDRDSRTAADPAAFQEPPPPPPSTAPPDVTAAHAPRPSAAPPTPASSSSGGNSGAN
ncbi:MAG TPA: hypothetical protein VLM79_32060 [Kofleriaceae bacterium]|nr:hypothetical protein [Kofleriaceae bacterium]